MGLLRINGFENQNDDPAEGDYIAASAAFTTTTSVRNGDGAYGQVSANIGVFGNLEQAWARWNRSAGRPVQAREVAFMLHLRTDNVGEADNMRVTLACPSGRQVGVSLRINQLQLILDYGGVLATYAYPFTDFEWYPVKGRIFIENPPNGYADVYLGDVATPQISVSGIDTRFRAEDYADRWNISSGGQTSWIDDVIFFGPSILLDVGSGSVAKGDTLTIGGTATVVVDDVDTDPDETYNYAASGSFVRVWVSRWNGTTFADGDTVTGGTLGSTTVVAPSAAYIDGFEPWSYPEHYNVNGRYVFMRRWTAQTTVNLTPVGSATNYLNVDNAPWDSTTYNEATSGANTADTYTTLAAPPGGIASIDGVQVSTYSITLGTYVDIDMLLTDATGNQSTRLPMPVANEGRYQTAALRADGSAWGTTQPTAGTYELRV